MTEWSDLQLEERPLSQLTAATALISTAVIVAAQQGLYPPNHNDFLAGSLEQPLWLVWRVIEAALSAVVFTPYLYEIVALTCILGVGWSIYHTTTAIAGARGGAVATVLFAFSPLALGAAATIPVGALLGALLLILFLHRALTEETPVISALLGGLTGFYPLYGVTGFLVVVLSRLTDWANDNNPCVSLRTVPVLVCTTALTLWTGKGWSLTDYVSELSTTLPDALSPVVLATWFGPITVLAGVFGVYWVFNQDSERSFLVWMMGVGAAWLSLSIGDPVLALPIIAGGLYPVVGDLVSRVLDAEIKAGLVTAVYSAGAVVLLLILTNTATFIQGFEAASRPTLADVQGLRHADLGDGSIVITPQERPFADQLVSNEVRGEWEPRLEGEAAFDAVWVTDMVRLVGEGNVLVVTEWATDRYGLPSQFLNQSQCFEPVLREASGPRAWRNNCDVSVSSADLPST